MATGELIPSKPADGSAPSSTSTSSATQLPLRTASTTVASSTTPKTPNETTSTSKLGKEEFDVVADYRQLLAEDPELTKPVAAIEALISVLKHTSSSTAMETDEIVKEQVRRLKTADPNPLPIKAGTDLFTRFLARSLRQQHASGPTRKGSVASAFPSALDSFDKTRQHLLDNSQLFAQRAKEARDRIAERGSRYVGPEDVVLTAGGSRAVRALLLRAADRHQHEFGAVRFTVVYVSDVRSREEGSSTAAVAALRAQGVPVVEIDSSAVAHALEAMDVARVFIGAEAVTHDGGLVSRIGTLQLAQLTRAAGKELVVCAETHKFVQQIILNQRDLPRIGIRQTLLEVPSPQADAGQTGAVAFKDQVDFTPARLVSHIITEDRITIASGAYQIMLSMYS